MQNREGEMLWPLARRRHVSAELRQRLADVRRTNPESETWLALIEAALDESESGRWDTVAVRRSDGDRPVRAPLLHGAEISVDDRTVRRFLRRLGVDTGSAGELLQAAIRQDDANSDTALRVVAQVAALPLLHACAKTAGEEASRSWWEGYCPLCGAWPTLAEFRGLERKRWLRCGRCGTGWEVPWLRCPFCGETSHEHLGYLAPEDGETTRKVEVCDTCKGYVKAEPTVRPLPWWGVLLDDAATVPLDVAALDRGYHRPEKPGFALECSVVEGGGSRRGWWRT